MMNLSVLTINEEEDDMIGYLGWGEAGFCYGGCDWDDGLWWWVYWLDRGKIAKAMHVANSGYGWEDGMLCVLVLEMKGIGWKLQKPAVFFAGVLGKSKACGGSTSLVFFCPPRLVLAPPVAIVACLCTHFEVL